MKISKSQLIKNVATRTGQTQAEVATIINATLDEATELLASGNEVDLHGFGKFSVKERGARSGRNPQTGEAMEIAASNYVAWRQSSALKNAVN